MSKKYDIRSQRPILSEDDFERLNNYIKINDTDCVENIEPVIGCRFFPKDYQSLPTPNIKVKYYIKFNIYYQKVLCMLIDNIDESTPKCSIKLPNEILDQLFDYLNKLAYDDSSFGVLDFDIISMGYLNYGYNKYLLPYLDLSDYDFTNKTLSYINLADHNEIKNRPVLNKKTNKSDNFVRLKAFNCRFDGVKFDEIVKKNNDASNNIFEGRNCSFKDTGLKFESGFKIEGCFNNFEGTDLKNIVYMMKSKNYFINLKNTGAIIDPGNSLTHPYITYTPTYLNCNFEGCFIKGIHDLNLGSLTQLDGSLFINTRISCDGKVYRNNDEIHNLIDRKINSIAKVNNTPIEKVNNTPIEKVTEDNVENVIEEFKKSFQFSKDGDENEAMLAKITGILKESYDSNKANDEGNETKQKKLVK